jgi:hypothetical protein
MLLYLFSRSKFKTLRIRMIVHSLRGALQANKLAYFWLPAATVQKLPTLSPSVFVLLLGVAQLASLKDAREFEIDAQTLRTLCGFDYKTLRKAVTEAHDRHVYVGFTDTTSRTVQVMLIDPATGKSIAVTEEEQRARAREEYEKRMRDSVEKNGKYSPVNLLAWAMWTLGDFQPHNAHGEFVTRCVLCRKPHDWKQTLSVNPFKGTHGVYRCFECGSHGGLLQLVRERVPGGFTEALRKLGKIQYEEPALTQEAARQLKGYTADGRYREA